jgi:hypothetical protein
VHLSFVSVPLRCGGRQYRDMLNHARYHLVMHSGRPAVELIAECPLCGAMTRQALALAWLERSIDCSNCEIAMALDVDVLEKLRHQAVEAQAAIDEVLSSTV